jgi:hypothetical protein
MHPLKTWGVRLVFALIGVSLMKPAARGAVGGTMLAVGISILAAIARAFGANTGFVTLGNSGLLVIAGALLGAVIGHFWQPKWTILGRITLVQENLTELSFIHFARWVIIPHDKFPRLSESQPEERLTYDYFFFESNFNGDWEKYIDAFSQVVPGGMDNIWRWSVKYPGSRPISPFLAYIRNCQYDTDYYYSAYPGAATNDILGALKLVPAIEKLATAAPTLAPEQFRQEYDRTLVEIQNYLARTGPPPFITPVVAPPASLNARKEVARV